MSDFMQILHLFVPLTNGPFYNGKYWLSLTSSK
jgi:hypothetical protein